MISTLYCIAKLTSACSLGELEEWKKREIWVEIVGCVKNPGKVNLASGDTLGKAILAAKPKPFADLSSIDAALVLHEDYKVEIQPLSEISVRIGGCVKNSVVLELPIGSRICDLKGLVDLSPDYDPRFFRRKRVLKHQEEIIIPRIHK